jgi:hypothetical protein
MATTLYNDLIAQIRAAANDPTYHLHPVGDNYVLRVGRKPAWHEMSPVYSATKIEAWLEGYLDGIHAGYVTAKRDNLP